MYILAEQFYVHHDNCILKKNYTQQVITLIVTSVLVN